MNRPTRITLIALAILLLLGSSVYAWRSYSNKAKVRDLLTKTAEMMGSGPGGPPSPEGRERFREIREEVKALPESYQQAFNQSRDRMFQSQMEKRLDDFFKLSPAERTKELDKRIAESERRRKEREARQNNQQARASGGPPGGGGPNGGNGAPGGGRWGGPGGGGPGGRGGGLSGSLDRSTPEMRAKHAAYRRAMDQRRAQVGLPPSRR
jgi:hypothetical protein